MSDSAERSKSGISGPVTGILAALVLMFFTVRWILAQKPGYDWISEGTVRMACYIFALVSLAALSVFILKVRGRLKAETLFIILYLLLGLSYMAVSPLSSVPDETEHMLRTYGITIGDFIPPVNDMGEGGSHVPKNLIYMWDRSGARLRYMSDNFTMKASDDKEFMTYSNTAFYSPLTYLPQAVGVLLTRLVCNRPYVIAYMGRLFELIASGILIYYAIKLMPFGKNILLILSLLPMNMYECASLSGDGMAYAVTLLIIAYCFRLRLKNEGKMSKRDIVFLYILLALVASCKIVYAPFVLMAFIIPVERFGSRKEYAVHITCAGIMIFLLAIVWPLGIGSRYLLEYTQGVSAGDQVKYVITHPAGFLQVMIYTLIEEGEWLFKTYFAASLSYFSVGCNILVIFVSAAGLIYVCFTEKIIRCEDETGLKIWKRPSVILGLATFASVIFTFLSLYIEWTPYRAGTVQGLQGRYFIPLTFQAVYLFKKKYDKISGSTDEKETMGQILPLPAILMCMANLMVIVTLFVNYV